MCITAAILAGASLVASGVGAMASISTAKANATLEEYRTEQQNKQLAENRELARIEALQAENARLEEFRRQRAANVAAIAGSGVSENRSFLQGIAKAEDKALRLDLKNLRMSATANENRIADQIKVNVMNASVARANAKTATVGAIAGFVKDSASIFKGYQDAKKG